MAITISPEEIREAVVDLMRRRGLDQIPEDVMIKVRVSILGGAHAEGSLAALTLEVAFDAEHFTQGPYR